MSSPQNIKNSSETLVPSDEIDITTAAVANDFNDDTIVKGGKSDAIANEGGLAAAQDVDNHKKVTTFGEAVNMKKLKHAFSSLINEPVTRPENPFKLMAKLNGRQWLVFTAAFVGWSLDAMDFHLLNLCVSNIALDFKSQQGYGWISNGAITSAITLTLLFRPIGALLFGMAGDKWGRRYPLMANVIIYSVLELATGFAPNYPVFLFIRCLFGIAMGGEWGLGGSLALEALPVECRGLFSGILQQGYAFGNLLAAGVFYGVTSRSQYAWRSIFWIGSFPALLVIFIRFAVPESEAHLKQHERRALHNYNFFQDFGVTFRRYWPRAVYCIILMSFFNFFSHGSQDLYPTYITSLGYSNSQKAVTTAIASTGAIIGGSFIGYLGQYIGRRRAIILSTFIAGCIIYPWAYANNIGALQTAAFFMQFFVQGAWGVVPAHLNELSPPAIRATFPGLMYNTGNMISAASAQIEAILGEKYPSGKLDKAGAVVPNYGLTQAVFIAVTVFGLIVTTIVGDEAKDQNLNTGELFHEKAGKDKGDTPATEKL